MVFDPMSTIGTGAATIRDQFPDSRVPASRFDPVSSPLLSRHLALNGQERGYNFNNFFRAPSDSDDTDQYDVRIDHNFSDTERVLFRMSVGRQFRVNQSPLPVEVRGQGGQTVDLN